MVRKRIFWSAASVAFFAGAIAVNAQENLVSSQLRPAAAESFGVPGAGPAAKLNLIEQSSVPNPDSVARGSLIEQAAKVYGGTAGRSGAGLSGEHLRLPWLKPHS